ncbi:molybdopterin-dependent oxidoreductase (plasmid) [Streptomyces sp. BI20]|uniref:molybdopterin-dependent oxidoreductase n=1 Tax=Streptomyces sp. BI20 TaxID=3403460 RepID=UPI003C753D95
MTTAVEKHGYCTLCKSRCGAIYTITDGRITGVRPDPEHPTGAAMCPKGRAVAEIAHGTGRLTSPLRRTTPKTDPDPGWEEISWDEAMAEIADRITTIADETGPESVAFAVATPSGTMVSDATEWIERLIRLFGSPNTVYSAELCNWHKDFAHAFTFGAPLPPPDYAHTSLALLWGFNPAKTWLSQSAALSEAQSRGAKLAVVDPRRSTSALRADHWLRVRPGTDAALALGLANLLIETGGHDEEFVRSWTNGPLLVRTDNGHFLRAAELPVRTALTGGPGDGAEVEDAFVVWDERICGAAPYDTARAAHDPERFALRGRYRVRLRDGGSVHCVPAFAEYARACAAWTPERTAATTWIPEEEIRALAAEIAASPAVTYYGWTGVGQNANASQTERALATLYALTGSWDAPGGNHLAPAPAYRPATHPGQFAPEQRAKALGLDKHPLGPPATGYVNAGDLCTAVETGRPYPVRALVGFGSNLVVAQPDSDRVAAALRTLEFQVHLDLFHNPTSTTADIVLPVNSAWEHEALRFGFEIGPRAQEQVQLRPRMVDPVPGTRSDTEVVFDLARRIGLGAEFFDGDIDAAWNWQLEPLGLTTDALRATPGGVRVPRPEQHRRHAAPTGDGTVAGFNTPTRRVELYSERLADHGYPPVPEHRDPAPVDADHPLVLTCAKHGYFVHSQHRGVNALRRRAGDPSVDLHPDTAAAHGVTEGQWVELTTRTGTIRLRARFDDSLHPGVVIGEYGWWQQAPDLALPGADPASAGGSNYNRLVDHSDTDPLSGAVPLRAAACRLSPAPADGTWTGTRPFTVTALDTVTPGVRALTLTPRDGLPLPDFRPGQHLTVRAELPDGTPADPADARSYSLTGPAVDPDRTAYTLAVRHVPGGVFSTHVHRDARVGDTLHVTNPAGTFAVPTDTDHPVVLIAGGIGITPFLSHLETLAAGGGTVPEVVLHFGNPDSTEHPFRDRLRELAARIPTLRIVDHYATPTPADTAAGLHDRTGFIGAADIDADLIARRARFYLCGPQPMLDAVTEGLRARGVPRFEIFSEVFRPARRELDIPDDAAHTVTFARSGRTAIWRKGDGPLLDLGERAGVRMPSGCRVGQCESCACTVLAGEAAHLVTPSEDLPPADVLTCSSVPTTDLTLDA